MWSQESQTDDGVDIGPPRHLTENDWARTDVDSENGRQRYILTRTESELGNGDPSIPGETLVSRDLTWAVYVDTKTFQLARVTRTIESCQR